MVLLLLDDAFAPADTVESIVIREDVYSLVHTLLSKPCR
jgi:hypothetical protein